MNFLLFYPKGKRPDMVSILNFIGIKCDMVSNSKFLEIDTAKMDFDIYLSIKIIYSLTLV